MSGGPSGAIAALRQEAPLRARKTAGSDSENLLGRNACMESVVALTSPAHQVDRLKIHILAALSHLGDPTVSADIEALRKHADPFVRAHAVEVAMDDARRREADPAEVFHAFFHDRRQEVREEAIAYAASHPDERLIPTMAGLFGARTPPLPEAEHADAIARARHEVLLGIACLADRLPARCVPILESHLDRPGFQEHAVYGLQRAGARQDIPRLRALYDSLARTAQG